VYSSEPEAKAAIDRLKNQKGFAGFQEGFHIYPYTLNEDHWTEGFIVDQGCTVPSWPRNDHRGEN
jgi:hypothetical protein